MTDDEIRRIRRLVVGELPPAGPSPRAVDPRHEERFRRALSMSRRVTDDRSGSDRDIAAVAAGPVSATRAAGAAKAPAASHASAATGAIGPPMPPGARGASTRLVSAAPRRSAAWAPAHEEEGADADPLDPAPPAADSVSPSSAIAPTPAWLLEAPVMPLPPSHSSHALAASSSMAALPDAWAQGVADTVVTLCTSSDPSFHSWTIQVPIDSAALPHTELRMTFSRHHLLLRFSTQSTQSYALISAHQSQLQRLLRSDLPGDRHIDIELT